MGGQVVSKGKNVTILAVTGRVLLHKSIKGAFFALRPRYCKSRQVLLDLRAPPFH